MTAPATLPFLHRAGVVTALPFAVAVGLFGVAFGALAVASGGIGGIAAVVMSATTYAGSAQFAAAAVIATGGQPAAAIAAALLLNARYIAIGVSVARFLPGGPIQRFLAGQLVIDESWAIASKGGGEFDTARLLGSGALLWVAWVGGTVIGVIGGEALGDTAAFGMDAAFPALFLALLVTQLRDRTAIAAAVLGGAIALVLVPFTPPGIPIVAASAAALVGLARR